jgi:hypothetical protein
MTKFFDPLSGETRELNYHGIKCRREPDEPRIEGNTWHGTAPSFIFGNIWSKPMNRTQELPALLRGFDISSDDTVHIGFNAPAVPIPGYTPPKLTDPDVVAYGWRHGIFYVQHKAGMHSFTEPFFELYYADEETAYTPFAAARKP